MGLLNFLKTKDINAGVKDFQATKGAVLLDVRTAGEYAEGHIENSLNLPLQNIEQAVSVIKDKNTPLFVHCRSGGRSASATAALKKMGYTNVSDIGGIMSYNGKVVK
jgi:phage shock protein E